MKLLIITQVVDKNHDVLGFFHNWLLKFAQNFEQVTVICLQKGEYLLPENVKVFSLGKEVKASRWQYIKNFYKYIFTERKQYDAVFVHMNQEYVLLGGIFWRIFAKKIILWRNHLSGSWLTNVAVFFANVVCCTSKESYTARFAKTKIMPVGLDEDFFKDQKLARVSNSVLFLSRMSPVKNPDIVFEALRILNEEKIDFQATFIGDPPVGYEKLYEDLKQKTIDLGMSNAVQWLTAIPNTETPMWYSKFFIFINATNSGSLDKTIFEAALCGCLPITSNKSLINYFPDELIFKEKDAKDLSLKLKNILAKSEEAKSILLNKTQVYIKNNHSLDKLMVELKKYFGNK